MNQRFSLQEAKQIDIVEYLAISSYQPHKIRNNDYWYLSPLREEKEPSFKVTRQLKVWHDHGLGKGGSLIDIGILYYNCGIKEVVQKRSTSLSFHPQTVTVRQPLANTQKAQDALEPTIKVIAPRLLTNPSLCRYLDDRKIPFEIAEKLCKEVDFELNGKQFFAIGFENKSGGFELRNQFFKR